MHYVTDGFYKQNVFTEIFYVIWWYIFYIKIDSFVCSYILLLDLQRPAKLVLLSGYVS